MIALTLGNAAWAGRGGAMFANSEYGGGVGLRGCTISGHVDTEFDNNAEGVLVTVTDSDSTFVGSDTTDLEGDYDISFACPDEAGELYTILAEKQPGGLPPRLLADRVFTSLEDAEWHAFRIRWEAVTGRPLSALDRA